MSQARKIAAWVAAGLAASLALSGCQDKASTVAITPETVVIDGSSTVFPISRSAANRYMRRQTADQVSVSFSGTTAGFRRFCAGETDVGNASRAINDEERQACAANKVPFIELPLARDSMAIVVHPDNDWANDISVAELRKLWQPQAQGQITRWSQIRPGWPDREIRLFGRGKDSGTFDFFTRTVVGELRAIRADYVGSEDEESLVQQIANTPGALAFFGIGAYHRHWEELKLLAVDGGAGPVYPSLASVAEGRYQPLTRPLFLYVNTDRVQSKPALRPFLVSYFSDLRSWLHHTGYLPLDERSYVDTLARLRALTAP